MSFLQRFSSNKVVTLSDAPTIEIDLSLGPHCMVTLIGDRVLGNPVNISAAREFWTAVRQDGTGGRVLTFDTDWIAIDPSVTVNPTAESVSLVFAVGRDFGTGLKWYYTIIHSSEPSEGGKIVARRTINTGGTFSVLSTDHVIYVDTTAGAVTLTLPAHGTTDRIYEIIDIAGTFATNPCTLARNGDTGTIGGVAASYVLNVNGQVTRLGSDTTSAWWFHS